MQIRIVVGGRALTATLDRSATAADFVSLLPLTLVLTDYASTEKVSDLPRKLSTQGVPAGSAAKAGDIALYAPWGNLAIYYNDFSYSAGLVRFGRIDGSLDILRQPGALTATFELFK